MFTANDESGDLKLLDFGFSRTYLQGEHIKYIAGTPYTMSPEVFMRNAGPPADVWAVGVAYTSSYTVGAPLVEEIATL